MAIHKRAKLIQRQVRLTGSRIFSSVAQLCQRGMAQLLKGLFWINLLKHRQVRLKAGFILPTTVLLLLVVSLAVGTISLRTYSRTQETIGARQQQVIYNAATPAIDRAKAKIAYLLERHRRTTSGIPPEGDLLKMMTNTDPSFADDSVDFRGRAIADIYTFTQDENGNDLPDEDAERRIDIDGDGAIDNAWAYQEDTNNDGVKDAWIAYSIIFSTPGQNNQRIAEDENGQEIIRALEDSRDQAVEARANLLEIRNAPKSLLGSSERCPAAQEAGVEGGWFSDEVNQSFLRKNFQVNALVIPGILDGNGNLVPNPNATVDTIEFQQDRTFDLGNKWGAWFQNDLEAFPGEKFNWNGAMRTQGSFILGKDDFEAFLISSRYSCFNLEASASEIRVGKNVISGRVDNKANDEKPKAPIHIFKEFQSPDTPDIKVLGLANGSDDEGSVDDADYEEISEILLLDPVKVFLGTQPAANEDLLRGDLAANAAAVGWTDPDDPAAGWNAASPLRERITIQVPNENDQVNYGDTYRADDRFDSTGLTSSTELNEALSGDGEWEKTASQRGMRIIVGQRLELGEPLAPWDASTCAAGQQNVGRCHEARQRRTLKDNLAAVQATAIYHADVTTQPATSDGETPLACLATTVHPGTDETLKRASTFHNYNTDLGLDPFVVEDFFTGRGTNGWEFEPPSAAPSLNTLDEALRNLAFFAGDPKGGAPSYEPEQDDFVHPYPLMSQWGDFSLLRRIFGNNDNFDYDSLSMADKATVDTARCMVGMLAHNMSYLNGPDSFKLLEDDGSPVFLGFVADPNSIAAKINPINTILNGLPVGTTPEAAIEALQPDQDMVNIARFLMVKEQVRRDRDYGFSDGGRDIDTNGRLGCLQKLRTVEFPGLSRLCSDTSKYPALYSIFPGDTNHNGTIGNSVFDPDNHDETGIATRGFDPSNPADPDNPDKTGNNYLLNVGAGINEGVNDGKTYKAFTDAEIASMALAPREMGNWVLPHKAATGVNVLAAPNSMVDVLIKCDTSITTCDGEDVSVALKDAAIMDGRQLMNVRVMDLNLRLLADETSAEIGNDTWLATDNPALVYAFREDSVREDSIVRAIDPARNGPCTTDLEVQAETCWMDAGKNAFESTDPPLVTPPGRGEQVSIKPVDYWVDPDRRPYGFRLRQGADISRGNSLGVDESFSFVSDNPVYIMGDFNEHIANGAEAQEFTDILDLANFTVNEFYDRGRNLGTVNQAFGSTKDDQWRPTEVLSDAVSILSNNFCDGSVVDLFIYSDTNTQLTGLTNEYGCPTDSGYTSYTNYTDLQGTLNIANLKREVEDDNASPVKISDNGNPELEAGGEYTGTYDSLATNRTGHIIKATETTTNVSIYSGIVASRVNQSYGGLHNFPRFLEAWKVGDNAQALNISGAFFQLGFSASATAPYDQKKNGAGDVAWEPTTASIAIITGPDDGVNHEYYDPPKRNWGYDVALQKNAPGAVASKFVSQTPLVSEFYNALEINDPYIYLLCEGLDRSYDSADFNCIEPD